jgi:hypothetical protein
MTAAIYLFLSLPLLLSLAARGALPKVLGLVTGMFAILLSVEPGGAVLPWQDVLHEGPVPALPRQILLTSAWRFFLRVTARERSMAAGRSSVRSTRSP